MPSLSSTSDLFVAMLNSRTMADGLINRFDLMKVFGTRSREGARGRLKSATQIRVSKENIISVTVTTRSAQLSTDLANYYLDYLDIMNKQINETAARKRRLFTEERLSETKANLAKLEDALESFQTKNKTISIEQQTKATIDAAAQLQGRVAAAEVELQVMESYLSPGNPDVIRKRLELQEMARQLKQMEYGSTGISKETKESRSPSASDGERLNPAFVKLPSIGLDLVRLTREVKAQETLYMVLLSQYEQAKISETEDISSVQVLDRAVLPEGGSRPNVLHNLMMALFASTCFASFLAFYREHLKEIWRKAKSVRSLTGESVQL